MDVIWKWRWKSPCRKLNIPSCFLFALGSNAFRVSSRVINEWALYEATWLFFLCVSKNIGILFRLVDECPQFCMRICLFFSMPLSLSLHIVSLSCMLTHLLSIFGTRCASPLQVSADWASCCAEIHHSNHYPVAKQRDLYFIFLPPTTNLETPLFHNKHSVTELKHWGYCFTPFNSRCNLIMLCKCCQEFWSSLLIQVWSYRSMDKVVRITVLIKFIASHSGWL